MATKGIRVIKGMKDMLPEEATGWQYLEAVLRELMAGYGYQEIRTPIMERTELFKRSIGEVTDIVEKEMYTFEDRNGDMVSLRPEGTAAVVRAGIEHGLLQNQVQRLWYTGPMFRRENPQKGRYRQFHQLGVETFGMATPELDAELIIMTARLWKMLGLDGLELQLNSLGTAECRQQYRGLLVDYYRNHFDGLDEDSKRRLDTNPLRILDSKNPALAEINSGAPRLLDYLDQESKEHFELLQAHLRQAGVDYVVNPRLVRGLDYYSRTVFEWVTTELGAQGTVCAGGRFDGLVEQLGGRATPAAGFAMGLERLLALLGDKGLLPEASVPQVFMIASGDQVWSRALRLAERLRDDLPGLRLLVNCGGGGFKSQFKKADKSGARFAILLAEDELKNNTIGLKFLREDRPQQALSYEQLRDFLLANSGEN